MMSLRHIEVFHAIYMAGSISAAARDLNVSQPCISGVLRHAEVRCGFLLFHRGKGRLTPTDEAHALFREVSDVYARIVSLQQTAKNLARAVDGHIRLAVLPGFGLAVAPLAVAAFRARHPKVGFDIQTLHHADIFRSLHERQCDLAIGYDLPAHEKLDHREIGRGELVLLYRRGDMPSLPSRVDLRILEGRDFISLAHSGPLGALFNREVARLDLNLTGSLTIGTMYVAATLVRQGLGVAVVDDVTARACLGDDLDFRPFETPLSFGVHCIYLAERQLTKVTQAFIHQLSSMTSPLDEAAPVTPRAPTPRLVSAAGPSPTARWEAAR